MTNRVTLIGKVLDAPKVRSYEVRSATLETVSLWIETSDGARFDRFTIDVTCAKAGAAAKALPAGALAVCSSAAASRRASSPASSVARPAARAVW